MKAEEIIGIIAISLIGIGMFIALSTSSVIEYKKHKRQEKLFKYLEHYHNYYLPMLGNKTICSERFADDIYFVIDKGIPYDKCEELAQLLMAIGYNKMYGDKL